MALSEAEREALRRLHRVPIAEGWDFTMIGAAAQMIIATPGIQPRFTADLDGVVTTPTWDDYARLATTLTNQGFTRQGLHRFVLDEARIDLIPFAAALIGNGDRLAWPEGGDIRVLGFAEAIATATTQHVAPDLEIKVVSIPGLVLLKLNSYLDVPQARRRDIADIANQCEQYHSDDDDERFGLQLDDGTAISFEEAGGFLLGRDVGTIAPAVGRRLVEELTARMNGGQLALDVAFERGIRATDEQLEALEALFSAFRAGLTRAL